MKRLILAITRCLIICAEDYFAAINLPVKRRVAMHWLTTRAQPYQLSTGLQIGTQMSVEV